MTFEEFFMKKKIDLLALEKGNTSLYKEFRSHFALMGEKSFDHSKKYWFNNLRKQYALAEEAASVAQKKGMDTAAPDLNNNKAIAEKEAPQAAKPAGFKPRFKAPKSVPDTDKEQQQIPAATSASDEKISSNKPAGFKPRFKAGVTKPATGAVPEGQKTVEADKAEPSSGAETTKPLGFKPRFNAAMLKKKGGNTEEGKPVENVAPTETDSKAPLTSEPKTPDGETETPNKPKGFTPRFKKKSD